MKQYLELLEHVLENGYRQGNRTGIRTVSVPGAMLQFDMRNGFPAITVRKLAFKSAMGELVGFLRGYTSAADFRKLGCNVWDQNANENKEWLENPNRNGPDDLGKVYGYLWRNWSGIDQVRQCLDLIKHNPTSRRILFHAWNPPQLNEMCLPPCHLIYQFHVNIPHSELSLSMYVRSNDLALGFPFNVAEGAALLYLFAELTGYEPRWLTYHIGDAHIYETHIDSVKTMLGRKPLKSPKLRLNGDIKKGGVEWLDLVTPDDFSLDGYNFHPPISIPMAV